LFLGFAVTSFPILNSLRFTRERNRSYRGRAAVVTKIYACVWVLLSLLSLFR
jgi:hypothetical protein